MPCVSSFSTENAAGFAKTPGHPIGNFASARYPTIFAVSVPFSPTNLMSDPNGGGSPRPKRRNVFFVQVTSQAADAASGQRPSASCVQPYGFSDGAAAMTAIMGGPCSTRPPGR